MTPDDTWRDSAACAGADTEAFYPLPGRGATKYVRRICRECPVRQACLDDAIATGDHHGIRGGLTGPERARYDLMDPQQRGAFVVRVLKVAPPDIPCDAASPGTPAGYKQHRRSGMPPCVACTSANTEYKRRGERARGAKQSAERREERRKRPLRILAAIDQNLASGVDPTEAVQVDGVTSLQALQSMARRCDRPDLASLADRVRRLAAATHGDTADRQRARLDELARAIGARVVAS